MATDTPIHPTEAEKNLEEAKKIYAEAKRNLMEAKKSARKKLKWKSPAVSAGIGTESPTPRFGGGTPN